MGSISGSVSGHLVDPELHAFLEAWPLKHLDAETLPAVRAAMQQMLRENDVSAADTTGAGRSVLCEEVCISGGVGRPGVRALLHRPADRVSGRPGYLHVHGGGLVMGAPEGNRARDVAAVEAHGCLVLSPAYRLAPETKFPGAVEDLWASLKWFHDHADELGLDRRRIIIGGESAGGGLAAALAILARDRGDVPVAGLVLAYPMLDDRTGAIHSPPEHVGEFIWTRAMNQFSWSSILPCPPGSDDVSPYAAAARAVDLSGMPPVVIQTGALDLFVQENIDFASRLIAAGVPVTLHVYPGAYHGFDMAGDTRVGTRFVRDRDEGMAVLFRNQR